MKLNLIKRLKYIEETSHDDWAYNPYNLALITLMVLAVVLFILIADIAFAYLYYIDVSMRHLMLIGVCLFLMFSITMLVGKER